MSGSHYVAHFLVRYFELFVIRQFCEFDILKSTSQWNLVNIYIWMYYIHYLISISISAYVYCIYARKYIYKDVSKRLQLK